MTTDLEKKFFDTFGIEQKKYTQCCSMGCKKPNEECSNCEYHEVYKVDYPQISDRILLELICILSKYQKDRGSLLEIDEISLDGIKEEILEMLIYRADSCKYQVLTLFKEKSNG